MLSPQEIDSKTFIYLTLLILKFRLNAVQAFVAKDNPQNDKWVLRNNNIVWPLKPRNKPRTSTVYFELLNAGTLCFQFNNPARIGHL